MTRIAQAWKVASPEKKIVDETEDFASANAYEKIDVLTTTCSDESCDDSQFTRTDPFFVLSDLLVCDDSTDTSDGVCDNPNITFQRKWIEGYNFIKNELHRLDTSRLPEYLSPPDFVRVYKVDNNNNNKDSTVSISELAEAARRTVDSELSDHPAILFRGLENQVSTAADFSKFWDAVHANGTAWKPSEFVPIFSLREKVEGIDLVNQVDSPSDPIRGHNEATYLPNSPSRFALYCLHPASEGGETLIVKNEDLTRSVRPEVMDMVREAGGIFISKIYYDRYSGIERKYGMFWQDVCHTRDREECIAWFVENGHNAEDISFDEEGTMIVEFAHPGFVKDPTTGRDLWFNNFRGWVGKRADNGKDFHWDSVVQTALDEWQHMSAFKLQRGDFLVLDNKRVQHGRLPFRDGEGPPRTIVAVYTNDLPAYYQK